MDTSNALVNLIREVVKDETAEIDRALICRIVNVNEDGTLDIKLPSDVDNIITNIQNISAYTFEAGDYGILYKINNKLNNSFILAKVTKAPPEIMYVNNYYNYETINSGGGGGEGMTTVYVGGVAQTRVDFTLDPQTQINSKQNTITGAASTVTSSNLQPSIVVTTDENGKITSSGITATELNSLSGIQGNIQESITNLGLADQSMESDINNISNDVSNLNYLIDLKMNSSDLRYFSYNQNEEIGNATMTMIDGSNESTRWFSVNAGINNSLSDNSGVSVGAENGRPISSVLIGNKIGSSSIGNEIKNSVIVGVDSDVYIETDLPKTVGDNSVAIGTKARSGGNGSIAIGQNSSTSDLINGRDGSIAIGENTQATDLSISIGKNSSAISGGTSVGPMSFSLGPGGIAIGFNSNASSTMFDSSSNAISIGYNSFSKNQSVAIGVDSKIGGITSGFGAVAIGMNSNASNDFGISIGGCSTSNGGISIGATSFTLDSSGVAVGIHSVVYGVGVSIGDHSFSNGSISIGAYSNSYGESSIGIGLNSFSEGSGVISIGRNSKSSGFGSVGIGDSVEAMSGGIVIGGYETSASNCSIAIGNMKASYPGSVHAGYRRMVGGAGNSYISLGAFKGDGNYVHPQENFGVGWGNDEEWVGLISNFSSLLNIGGLGIIITNNISSFPSNISYDWVLNPSLIETSEIWDYQYVIDPNNYNEIGNYRGIALSTHMANYMYNTIQNSISDINGNIISINNILESNDPNLSTMQDIVDYTKENRNLINNISQNISGFLDVNSIADNLSTTNVSMVLSANQGVVLNGLISNVEGYYNNLASWVKQPDKPTYNASEVGAEPAFSKNTAFNKNFGNVAGTVCEGNDPRLSDARPASDVSQDIKSITQGEISNWNDVYNWYGNYAGSTITASDISDWNNMASLGITTNDISNWNNMSSLGITQTDVSNWNNVLSSPAMSITSGEINTWNNVASSPSLSITSDEINKWNTFGIYHNDNINYFNFNSDISISKVDSVLSNISYTTEAGGVPDVIGTVVETYNIPSGGGYAVTGVYSVDLNKFGGTGYCLALCEIDISTGAFDIKQVVYVSEYSGTNEYIIQQFVPGYTYSTNGWQDTTPYDMGATFIVDTIANNKVCAFIGNNESVRMWDIIGMFG